MKNFIRHFSREARPLLLNSTIIFHFCCQKIFSAFFIYAFIPRINYSWSSASPSTPSLFSLTISSLPRQYNLHPYFIIAYYPFSPTIQRIFDNKETVLISTISLTTYYPRLYRLRSTLYPSYSLSYFLRVMPFTSKFPLITLSYLLTPHTYLNILICAKLSLRHSDLT